MSELRSIVETSRALAEAGQPYLLATLVNARGSSSRRPGARLIIAPETATGPGLGGVVGAVSGGALERELVRRGWRRVTDGRPTLVSYDARDDEDCLGWGLGLGCGGAVDLLIEPVNPAARDHALSFVERCLARQTTGALVTVIRSDLPRVPLGARLALVADGLPAVTPALDEPALVAEMAAVARAALVSRLGAVSMSLAAGAVEALIEIIQPPPHLFVLGSGRDALQVATLSRALGWMTTVWDPRPRGHTVARFAGVVDRLHAGDPAALAPAVEAAARPLGVVMSHDHDGDRAALGMLLRSPAHYVGVLGPARRTQRLLDELHLEGEELTGADLRRLHAPIGLAIGAESPVELALAIVGEAQATLTGGAGGRLRAEHGSALPLPRAPALFARAV